MDGALSTPFPNLPTTRVSRDCCTLLLELLRELCEVTGLRTEPGNPFHLLAPYYTTTGSNQSSSGSPLSPTTNALIAHSQPASDWEHVTLLDGLQAIVYGADLSKILFSGETRSLATPTKKRVSASAFLLVVLLGITSMYSRALITPQERALTTTLANNYLEEGQDLLRQLVVEVGIFRAAHVVDEDEAGLERLQLLERHVQLEYDALEGGLVVHSQRAVPICGE